MDDKHNELQSADGGSCKNLSKTERIQAIKNSIHKSSEQPSASAENKQETVAAPDSDWDNEIAERIAKRIQKVKADKNSAESIISELDSIAPAAEETESSVSGNADMPEEALDTAVPEAAEIGEALTDENAAPEAIVPKKKAKKKKSKEPKTLKESLLGLLPQKKDNLPERIRKIVFMGSCAAIIVCGTIVVSYYVDIYSSRSRYQELAELYPIASSSIPEKEEAPVEEEGEIYTLLPGAKGLLEINSEVAGYLIIPGSKDDEQAENEIAYPVMQSDDLKKYLDKDFYGKDARAGALFLDYRNRFDYVVDGKLAEPNSDNLIIYGHNMQSGDMFGKLKNYRNNSNYYGEHPVILLNSNYKQYQYKIFAFFIVDAEDKTDTAYECWNQINFADETEFYDFVNEAKKRTIRLNDVDVKYGDKLLTLSTCNSIFGNDGSGRLIIMARLVRDGEDPYEGTQNSTENLNIKWPSLYYEYNSSEHYDPDAEFIPYGETVPEAETTTTEE